MAEPGLPSTDDKDMASKLQLILSQIDVMSRKLDKLDTRVTNVELDTCSLTSGNFYVQLANSVTSMVGLKESVSSKYAILRWFWAALLVAGISATIFYIYETASQFLEYQAATNMQLRRNTSYEHPPLLLCNDGWLDLEKVKATGLSNEAIKYSLGYFDDYHTVKIRNVTAARQEFAKYYSRNFYNLADFFKSIAVDFKRANSSQEFAALSKPAFFCRKCAKTDPVQNAFLITTGVCQRFFLEDSYGGLVDMSWNNIFVKIGQGSRKVFYNGSNVWTLYYSHDAEDLTSVMTNFLYIPPYQFTLIRVTCKKYFTLQRPGQVNCRPNTGEPYSPLHCMAECENSAYWAKFKCKPWLLHPERGHNLAEYCNYNDPYGHSTWSEYSYSDETMEISKSMTVNCYDECPSKCERVFFDVSIISESKLADADYEHITESRFAGNMSIAALNIVHNAVGEGGVMTYVEVNTYSFIELVNNIGGTLGLFVGGTLMTIVQATVFIVTVAVEKFLMSTTFEARSI